MQDHLTEAFALARTTVRPVGPEGLVAPDDWIPTTGTRGIADGSGAMTSGRRRRLGQEGAPRAWALAGATH